MPGATERHSNRNGFGVVVLGLILTICMIVNMWLRAPLMAHVLGPAAYGIALLVSAIAACIAALIFDEEESVEHEVQSTPRAAPIPVEVRRQR